VAGERALHPVDLADVDAEAEDPHTLRLERGMLPGGEPEHGPRRRARARPAAAKDGAAASCKDGAGGEPARRHSTVTLFARFLGWSTSQPRSFAT
jgi:hypothetical protein